MVVDYINSTTIKIEPAERHRDFNVSSPDAGGKSKYQNKIPAIRVRPDVWEQAPLKTYYVELQFENASGVYKIW